MDFDVCIRSLDRRAIAYVLDHLRNANVLCSALYEIVSQESGAAFTIAPKTASTDKLHRFREGDLLPQDWSRNVTLQNAQGVLAPIPSLVAERAERILETLEAFPAGACVIDDANPRWGELNLADNPFAFGVGDEVYHCLAYADGKAAIKQTLELGDAHWHGVAAICARAPSIDSRRIVSAESLRASAATVVEITCAAYDGEGFIGWRRG
ncbi:MAG TPA: hypothetical protein VNH64_01225 [Parvularculaceae bacterium]|nr:hypothetical protein [Parvularculaceae bacterium]